jgi:energy-coupling factor transporter ATP-binding protein EcfA2
LSGLRGQSINALKNSGFTDSEADIIFEKVRREAIDQLVLTAIKEKSGGVCCFCANGNNTQPYQIHHIEEYFITGDNCEDNLALVCPSHHSVIHATKLSYTIQRETKESWQNTWEIVSEYQGRGINFPFGAFENLNYRSEGSITEIFNFASPTPTICLRILQNELANDAREILDKHNKLIISGESGSGKSTLAKGIGGICSGSLVFNYIAPKNMVDGVAEILKFFSFAIRPVTLIIDNANFYFSSAELETIFRTATKDKKIIVTYTRTLSIENDNSEQHYLSILLNVDWQRLQYGILQTFQTNEIEVLDYLRKNSINDADGYMLGSGIYNITLKELFEKYAGQVKSVWQFIYLIGGGFNLMDDLHVDLVKNDRTDIIVTFVAVHQLSLKETGINFEQIKKLYVTHSALNIKPAPEDEWLKQNLTNLIKRNILKVERGRFNTIHREFARKFLEISYLKTTKNCEEILNEIFFDFKRIREIVILWSWMYHSLAKEYVSKWKRTLNDDQLKTLITNAADDKLSTISILADRLHNYGFNPDSILLKELLEDKILEITILIDQGEDGTLYYLNKLFSSLKEDNPDFIVQILDFIDDDNIYNLIKTADPESFEYLFWLFNSIYQVYPEWIKAFSKKFTNQDFFDIISKVEKGDLDSLTNIFNCHKSYFIDLTRGTFKQYSTTFAAIIKNCSLKEIRFSPISVTNFVELMYFEKDVNDIFNQLNIKQLSEDFGICSPRYWGNLLTISGLGNHYNYNVITQIVEGIDVATLNRNIANYFDQYFYELRVLIYQLCYAREAKKQEFSQILYPYIHKILAQHGKDQSDVLAAFCSLDEMEGRKICNEFNLTVPAKLHGFPQRPDAEAKKFLKQIEELERVGNDWILRETIFNIKENH